MIEVYSEQEWKEQLSRNERVMALFYASWCPFCRGFIATFRKSAQKSDSEEWISVNVDDDDNPLWEEYSLEAVPSVILFVKGNVAKRLDCDLGRGLSEKQFYDWLKQI